MNQYCAVVIPVYAATNERLNYFSKCLESVRRQEYPTLAIVVDDGSPKFDDVRSIVSAQESDMFRLVQRERGVDDKRTSSNALNYGLELILKGSDLVLSSNEQTNLGSVCYLHSDDMFAMNSVAQRVDGLKFYPVVYSNMFYVDTESRPLAAKVCLKKDIQKDCAGFTHHSVMWSFDFLEELDLYVRERYVQDGIFDNTIDCEEDREATLSMMELCSKKGYELGFVDKCTYIYRKDVEDNIGRFISWDFRKLNKRRINDKHGLSRIYSTNYGRLISDLPWSLFTFMPNGVKAPLRYPRDVVKYVLGTGVKNVSELPKVIENDPLLELA